MSKNMLFCLGSGKCGPKDKGYQKNNQIFNVEVTKKKWEKAKNSLPTIKLPIAKWIEKKNMTEDKKEIYSYYKQTGGYLKEMSYEDAWAEVWENLSKEDKQKFLDLPHFDSKIFKSITGIDINRKRKIQKKHN